MSPEGDRTTCRRRWTNASRTGPSSSCSRRSGTLIPSNSTLIIYSKCRQVIQDRSRKVLHKNKVWTGGPARPGLAWPGPVRSSSSNLCCHFRKTSSAPLRTASLPEASGRINYCLCSCCPGTKKRLGSAPEPGSQGPGSPGAWFWPQLKVSGENKCLLYFSA